MRILGILLLVPMPLWADDLVAPAPVSHVILYPQGALVTRTTQIMVPKGEHRIILPLPRAALENGVPRLTGSGDVTIKSVALSRVPFDPDLAMTPAHRAAQDAVDAARDALATAERALSAERANIGALLAQQDFYQSVQGGSQLASPQELRDIAALLGTELPRISAAIAQAELALPDLSAAQHRAEAALERAEQRQNALAPPKQDWPTIVVDTSAVSDATLVLALNSLTRNARWHSAYRLDLDETSGKIVTERSAVVQVSGAEPWVDVDLTLSTLFPFDQVAASEVFAQIVRSIDPEGPIPMAAPRMMPKAMAEPMMDAVALETASFAAGEGRYDGSAFVYRFDGPQSLAAGAETRLSLTPLSLSADVTMTANPRQDETAFMAAKLTNDSGGPLLAGPAQLYREGRLVGATRLPEIADGAEATLPFGPIEHLRLKYVVEDRMEGDKGILTKSNTRTDKVSFSIQNLGNSDESVTALYALPVTEQEALTVEVTSSPAPATRNTDAQRGVATWDLNVPAGTTKTVSIQMALSWPKGEIINWRP